MFLEKITAYTMTIPWTFAPDHIISTYNTQGQVIASYMGLYKRIGRCAIVSVLFTNLTLVAIPN